MSVFRFTTFWLFLTVLVVVVPLLAVAQPIQWPVAEGGNDHWYEAILIGEEGIRWDDAQAEALDMGPGWHLATSTSAAENEFIYGLISDAPEFWEPWGGHGAGPWLGAYLVGPGIGDYEWVTGEPFVYTHWGLAQPAGDGDRLSLMGVAEPLGGPDWNDVSGTTLRIRGFIAENASTPIAAYSSTWSTIKAMFY